MESYHTRSVESNNSQSSPTLRITFDDEPIRHPERSPRPTAFVMITCTRSGETFRVLQSESKQFRYEHALSCLACLTAIADTIEANGIKRWITRRVKFIMECFELKVIKHKAKRGGDLSACGSACMSARGATCDCACRGRLHGSAHDWSREGK